MSIVIAAAVAALAVATAIGHSLIGERRIFPALYAEPRTGVLASRPTRAVLRAVFHLPSFAWVVLGMAVLVARLDGGDRIVSAVAALIFASAGIGNLVALRRLHPGGVMMLVAAALTIADHFAAV